MVLLWNVGFGFAGVEGVGVLGVDEGESLGREEGRGGGVSELGNGVKVLRARCGGGGCAGVVVGPEENIIRFKWNTRERKNNEQKRNRKRSVSVFVRSLLDC